MLKIKDNVDLKVLEKFGLEFKKGQHKEQYSYALFVRHTVKLSINIYTREIKVCHNKNAFDKLFDLIQAGLIEKV